MSQAAPAEPPTYSVVIPVYNSAGILPELHRQLSRVMQEMGEPYEIVMVEDCGPDNAWEVLSRLAASDPALVAIQLMRNSGQGSATLCGLAHARGRLVITMDDDLQHPPAEIPRMVRALLDDDSLDVVLGVPHKRKHSLFRRLGSRYINWVGRVLYGGPRAITYSSFRVMRRQVVEAFNTMRVPYPSIAPMLASITHRVANMTVDHHERSQGRSGYTVMSLLRQSISNLIGYSLLPLRLLALVGGVGMLGCLVYGFWVLWVYFTRGAAPPGWTTVILLLVSLFGLSFFAFAILGCATRVQRTSG